MCLLTVPLAAAKPSAATMAAAVARFNAALDAAAAGRGNLFAGSSNNPVAGGGTLGVKEGQQQAQQPRRRRFKKSCGTHARTADEEAALQPKLQAAELLVDREDASWLQGGTQARLLTDYIKNIQVHWHVIRKGDSYSDGNLSRDTIDKQMAVLNQRFEKANFQFTLASVDWTTNPSWFNVKQGSEDETAMRTSLHQGGLQDLNVYSASPMSSDGQLVAGFTKLPEYAQQNPQLDGCIILYDSLPGGQTYGLDRGMTLVHEVGHYFGLAHPWENGCNEPGDGIGDTPYSASAAYDCVPKNSCPNTWGMDPVTNPMQYSPDSCMTQFTTMQCKKMRANWYAFRA